MPSFEKRGRKTKAIVFINDKRQSKTFLLRRDAEDWAREMERKRSLNGVVPLPSHDTLASMIDRYVDDDGDWSNDKTSHLARLRRQFGHMKLSKLTTQAIVDYIIGLKLQPSNAQSHLSYFSSVLVQAKCVYGRTVRDQDMADARQMLSKAGKIAQSVPRIRRPEDGELATIMASHEDTERSVDLPEICEILNVFPIRVGELCRIKWTDIDHKRRMVMLRERKDPDRRVKATKNQLVPLYKLTSDGKEVDIYDLLVTRRQQYHNQDGPFPFEVKAVSNAMLLARAKAGLKGSFGETLHIHDLRRHAISTMLENEIEPPMVMLISGHSNAVTFYRNYVNLNPEKVRVSIERKMLAA